MPNRYQVANAAMEIYRECGRKAPVWKCVIAAFRRRFHINPQWIHVLIVLKELARRSVIARRKHQRTFWHNN